jgi:hypothetical protein
MIGKPSRQIIGVVVAGDMPEGLHGGLCRAIGLGAAPGLGASIARLGYFRLQHRGYKPRRCVVDLAGAEKFRAFPRRRPFRDGRS